MDTTELQRLRQAVIDARRQTNERFDEIEAWLERLAPREDRTVKRMTKAEYRERAKEAMAKRGRG